MGRWQLENMPNLKEWLLPYYLRANTFTRGTLEVIRVTVKHFSLSRGAEAGASLAYYALFSLFPLLLVLISVAGFVIRSETAYQTALNLIYGILPNARPLVDRNLELILDRRATIGVIGLGGALWSASGFFNTLVRNINRAWLGIKPRGELRTRLLALAMIGALIVLLILSLLSTAAINLLGFLDQILPEGVRVTDWSALPYLRLIVPSVFNFLLFLVAYRWIPNTRVYWRACIWGAVWTSIAWELAKYGFGLFVTSDLGQFELLYGSLGTVLALMLYIYISCLIILLGAHLTATIDGRQQQQPQ
jgi:membrane protein